MTTDDLTKYQTLRSWAELAGLRASIAPVDGNPNMHGAAMPGARHYRVTLTAASYPGRLSCFYSMGSAHGTTPPDPVDVLDCLLSDHDIRSECTDALDLAAYFGEIPQTQAERDSYRRSWHSLTQQSIGLRRWLGADLDDIAELERE